MTFCDVCGWLGAVLMLASYWLVSKKKVEGDGWIYQFLNLSGALGLLIAAADKSSWPNVALEVVWIAIGVHAVKRLIRRSRT